MKLLPLIILVFGLSFHVQSDDGVPIVVGPDGRGHVVEQPSKNGDVTTETFQMKPEVRGVEVKQVDKSGNVLQWYQGFLDAQGHEILSITRKSPGNHPSYGGIEETSVRTYNSNGNVAEEYTYSGDGILKNHIIYRYSWWGSWLRGDAYDSNGKFLGSTPTPPEAFLYGLKK